MDTLGSVSVLGTVIALAGVVLVLHLDEKVSVVHMLIHLNLFLFVSCSARTSWSADARHTISTLRRYDSLDLCIGYKVIVYSILVYLWNRHQAEGRSL